MSDLLVSLKIRALDEFSRVLANAKSGLKELSEALHKGKESSEGAFKFGERLNQTGEAVSRVGEKLREFVKEPVDAFQQLEYSMAKVKARTRGLTDEEFKELGEAAEGIGRSSLLGADAIAGGFLQLANEGRTAGEQLSIMKATAELALGANLDLGQGLGFVQATLSKYNLKAGQAGALTDLLAGTAKVSETSVAELGTALDASALGAHRLGVGIEDSTKLIAALSSKDIKGSAAGEALNNIFKSLAGGGRNVQGKKVIEGLLGKVTDADFKKPTELLSRLGEALQPYSKVKQQQALRLIFREGATGAGALIDALKDPAIKNLPISFDRARGAAKGMADTMRDTGLASTKDLQLALHELDTTLGSAFGGKSGFKEVLAGWVSGISAFLKQHPWVIKAVMGTALALGTLLTVVGGAIGAFASLAGVWGTLQLALPVLSALGGLLASIGAVAAPILAVVAALAAMGLAISELVKYWKDLNFGEVWQGIKDVFGEGGVGGVLKQAFDPTALIHDIVGSPAPQVASAGGGAEVGGTVKIQVEGPARVGSVERSGPVGLDVTAGLQTVGG